MPLQSAVRQAEPTPSIAIEPGSPTHESRSATRLPEKGGDEREREKTVQQDAHGRNDSDGSRQSFISSRLSPQTGRISLAADRDSSLRPHAFGLDEEIKTPATPYFDVDPNLVPDSATVPHAHMSQADRFADARDSRRLSLLQRSMSSPTMADASTTATKRPYVAPIDTTNQARASPRTSLDTRTPNTAASSPLLVSSSTLGGTISQRRRGLSTSRVNEDSSRTSTPLNARSSGLSRDASATSPPAQTSPKGSPNSTVTGRQRAASQPSSRRPSLPSAFMGQREKDGSHVPPVPSLPRQPRVSGPDLRMLGPGNFRFPAGEAQTATSSAADETVAAQRAAAARDALFPARLFSTISSGTASYATENANLHPSWLVLPPQTPGSPYSPAALPSSIALRPFALMRMLHGTLASNGFVSRRMHVSKVIWAQQTSKLQALESKVRALDLLEAAVDTLDKTGRPLLGPQSREESGAALLGARFAAALEDFEGLLVEVQNTLAKKLNFLPSVSGKKGGGVSADDQ